MSELVQLREELVMKDRTIAQQRKVLHRRAELLSEHEATIRVLRAEPHPRDSRFLIQKPGSEHLLDVTKSVRLDRTFRYEAENTLVVQQDLINPLAQTLRDFAAYQNGTDYQGSPFEKQVNSVLGRVDERDQ